MPFPDRLLLLRFQPDEWALGAALLWKHQQDPYFKQQAQGQLTNFTNKWLNVTQNGTLAYGRSGFFGWMMYAHT